MPCVDFGRRIVSAYDDLVVPLLKNCPQALKTPNNAGVTPEDLMNWMEQKNEVVSPNTVIFGGARLRVLLCCQQVNATYTAHFVCLQ